MKFSTLVIIRDLLEREVKSLEVVYKTAVQSEADVEPGTSDFVALRNARRAACEAYDRVRTALVEFDLKEW